MTGVPTSRADQRRYRNLLRTYPPAWREQHEEALLGILLDAAEASGRTGPTITEAGDLIVHGLRVRLAYLAPQQHTRDFAALLALALGWGTALVLLGVDLWVAATDTASATAGSWPFATARPLLEIPWLATLPLLLLGRRRAARALLLAGAPLTVIVLTLDARWGVDSTSPVPLTGLGMLGILAALGRPERSRPRMAAALTAVTTLLIADAVRITRFDQDFWQATDPAAAANPRDAMFTDLLYSDVLTALVGALLLAVVFARWRRHWLPSLLLVTSVWLGLALGPVGLFLAVVEWITRAFGIVALDLRPTAWLASALVCLVLAGLAAQVRWHIGPPDVGGRSGAR